MKNAFQTRMLAIVLGAVTLAACVLAGLNLAAESGFEVPTDGVSWMEVAPPAGARNGADGPGLCAQQVPADSPGAKAGLKVGDIVTDVGEVATPREAPFIRQLFRVGAWEFATYTVSRPRQPCEYSAAAPHFSVKVTLIPTDRSVNMGLRLIALVYLLIGLYVLLRRWTAPKSTHFFVFCLISFVLYAFKYTGQLDTFDEVIFWANLVATSLQPALFLHFAFTFTAQHPDSTQRLRRRMLAGLLYLPGLYLVLLQVFAVFRWSATEALKHRLDKISLGYMAVYYVWAAAIFYLRAQRTESPLERQQLKWLTRGTLVAVVPFTLLYVVPFLADWAVPSAFANVVRLSLVFLPLTFSWAIVRYRLMDVDLIFKRGVTYTLATAALIGLYFGVVALAGAFVHQTLPTLKVWGLVAAVAAAGLLFDPLKRAIQARVDRVFDQKRFDYRETLVDFGRSLNSQTDLRALVDSIVERLPQTLLVTRVAVFLATEHEGEQYPRTAPGFDLAASHGLTLPASVEIDPLATALDLRFLDFDAPDAYSHLFLENPLQALHLTDSERQTAARLDLNYYVPCRVANRAGSGTRTVAVVGLGRTRSGDFLSSEDMEVLESLAGYIGIAIQNAQLYRRLESKIAEFERLKDFNQNIVESINIGIFAVDLDDRIESWNAQMEVLFALPREAAVRRHLADILPPEFVERFTAARGDDTGHGTHTLYKFRLALPTGETRTANIAIAPLLTRTLDVIGRIILVDDITAQIELEGQLAQSEKLSSIGLLAAGVAHEVNTPLAVISSYTQMLTKQVRADEAMNTRLGPVLEKITQQTFRASEIVNGLLNFSRTSGTEFISIDVNRLLHDSTILLDHQFKTARVRVIEDLAAGLAPIQGNQGKLQQVILNLMLNAKDAMQGAAGSGNGGSQLTLRTSTEDDQVIIEFADNGSGIAAEHLNRIFDPFFTTKTNPQPGQHKGTGLGLAVSYGILQEHGGQIKVESTVGEGTTFRLELPVAGYVARQGSPPPPPTSEVETMNQIVAAT